ncbi:MAG: hypothetical protein Q8R28_14160 [Dehalococcoidia bacterium]|nr:hypothetical protein [Dehalococcoidia bacterium]
MTLTPQQSAILASALAFLGMEHVPPIVTDVGVTFPRFSEYLTPGHLDAAAQYPEAFEALVRWLRSQAEEAGRELFIEDHRN